MARVTAVAVILFGIIAIARVSIAAGSTPSTSTADTIFVADSYNVTAYPIGSSGDVTPIALTTDFAGPSGIARDGSGRLYVTNRGSNTITVFAANANGNVPPIATIGGFNTRLSNPAGIALDANGAIYVVNNFGNSGSITVYPPLAANKGILNESPTATIIGAKTLLNKPSAITVDSLKNIYVANGAGGPVVPKQNFDVGMVTVYAARSNGNTAPMASISGAQTGLAFPMGIALDSANNIYVANFYTANTGKKPRVGSSITVYSAGSNGNVSPTATIAGSNTGFSYLGGIALDSTGNLYAGSCAVNGSCFNINLYPPGSNGNVAPATTIFGPDTGIFVPAGITLDAARNIYVLNTEGGTVPGGGITVFPAGSSGDTKPSATIYSRIADLFGANGIAVDSNGNIYVADQFAGNGGGIAMFPAGSYATGVPPVATITGLDTGLANPSSIAVDGNGNIFALSHNCVTEYPAGSVGDAMPTASFCLQPGANAVVTGIAVNAAGRLYATVGAGTKCRHGKCHPTGSLGEVVAWPVGSDGSQKPNVVITGHNTNLASPSAIAVDQNGSIYVTSQGALKCQPGCSCVPNGFGEVTAYGHGANGDFPAFFIIAGSKTGLTFPDGITVDSTGLIYVLNANTVIETCGNSGRFITSGASSILLFAPGSNGNVAPILTISGPYAGLNNPFGIAIGPGQ